MTLVAGLFVFFWVRNGGVETSFPVSNVIYGSDGTIRLNQTVLSFDNISFSLFLLLLDVSGVLVVDVVFKSVVWVVILEAKIQTSLDSLMKGLLSEVVEQDSPLEFVK
jgi:hypothetical protein